MANEVCDPRRDDPRLAGSGASQNQERLGRGADRRLLLAIESEMGFSTGHGGLGKRNSSRWWMQGRWPHRLTALCPKRTCTMRLTLTPHAPVGEWTPPR